MNPPSFRIACPLDFSSVHLHVLLIMHELGIAESALEMVLTQARKADAAQVERIVIRVGALSGVDVEALRFAFTAVLPGTPAEGAILQIDPVPAVAYCPDCQRDFTLEDNFFMDCPRCGRPTAVLKQGRELDLVRLEVT